MKSRTYKYRIVKKILKLAKQERKTGCIEFPHFGAHYPDARCVDGYLWDLDSCDDGFLTSGGDAPCPVCNTRQYVGDMIDNEVSPDKMLAHIRFIFSRYGHLKTNQQ